MKRGEFVSRVVLAGVGLCMLFLDIETLVRGALPAGFDEYAAGYIAGLRLSKYLVAAGLMVGALGWRWFWRMFMGGDGKGSQRGTTPHLTSPPRGEECAGVPPARGEECGTSWGGVGVAIVALTVVALVLRTVGLNSSLTYDEVFLVKSLITQNPIRIFMHPSGSAHILHSLLANGVVRLLGVSEWTVRLPAMVIGSVTPALVYVVLRRFSSQLTALAVAGFMLISPIHIWYSQEAKGNALLVFFVALSWAALLDRRGRITGAHPWLYALSLIGAGVSHLSGCFLVLGHVVAVLVTLARKQGASMLMKRTLLIQFAAIYTVLLIHSPILFLARETGKIATKQEGGIVLSEILWQIIDRFLLLDGSPLVHGLIVLLVVAGLVQLCRATPTFVVVMVLPFLLSLLATVLLGLFSHARYHMVGFPVAMVCAGAGAAWLISLRQQRGWKWVGALVVVLIMFVVALKTASVLRDYYKQGKSNYAAIAKHLEQTNAGVIRYVPCPNKKCYPAMAFTFYCSDFVTDDGLAAALASGSNAEVDVVVLDPMCLGVSYRLLSEALEGAASSRDSFRCMGELDQYRVRDSCVYRVSRDLLVSHPK